MQLVFEGTALISLILLVMLSRQTIPALRQGPFALAEGRLSQLDGLRGLLSVLVVFHHALIFRLYAASGTYDSPPGNAENLAGDASVALFFMITGFFLWGRMLRTQGKIDWTVFFISRLRRLAPMYAVAVAVLVVIVLVETHFTLQVSLQDFMVQVLRWLGFGLLDQTDINGRPDTHAIEVVLWTLKYEWVFYTLMPLLAVFSMGRRPWLLYGAALLILFKLGDAPLYGYFVAGALSAHLNQTPALRPRIWMMLSPLALVWLIYGYHDIYGLPQIGLLFLVFQGIVTGLGPWKLLTLPTLRLLGTLSYSLYLLHHMVLHVLVFWLLGPQTFAALTDAQFALAGFCAGVISVVLSILCYRIIEWPWLKPSP